MLALNWTQRELKLENSKNKKMKWIVEEYYSLYFLGSAANNMNRNSQFVRSRASIKKNVFLIPFITRGQTQTPRSIIFPSTSQILLESWIHFAVLLRKLSTRRDCFNAFLIITSEMKKPQPGMLLLAAGQSGEVILLSCTHIPNCTHSRERAANQLCIMSLAQSNWLKDPRCCWR